MAPKKNPLISYLSGTATPLQAQQIEAWIHAREENKEVFGQIKEAWKLGEKEILDELIEQSQEQVLRQEEEEPYVPHDFVPHAFPTGYTMMFIRVAASLLILAGIYFLFESKIDAVLDKAYPEMQVLDNLSSQVEHIKLTEFGEVKLASQSKLSYPKQVHGDACKLRLHGDAEFHFAPRELAKSFKLYVGSAILEFTHGVFSLSQEDPSSPLILAVKKGEVSFQAHETATPLTIPSGQKMTYTFDNDSYHSESFYSEVSLQN